MTLRCLLRHCDPPHSVGFLYSITRLLYTSGALHNSKSPSPTQSASTMPTLIRCRIASLLTNLTHPLHIGSRFAKCCSTEGGKCQEETSRNTRANRNDRPS